MRVPAIVAPGAIRNRWLWHLAALGALVLGAIFNAWDWLAQDRMPGGDFPGYAAQIQYVRDALLHHGRVPAWCIECDGGRTNFTSSLKEILAFPLALVFDSVLATKLALLIGKISAGFALYALIACYLAAPGAGIVAGYSLAFGEIANYELEHLDVVLALVLRVVIVIATIELLRRGGIGWIAALGVLAASLFVNNGVHALLVPVTVIALVLVRPGLGEDANPWRNRRVAARFSGWIAAAAAVALLLAAGQIAWIALDSKNHRLFMESQRAMTREWAIERSPFLFVNRDNVLAPWLATHHPPGLDLVTLDAGRRYVGIVTILVCSIGAFAMRGARNADLRRWAVFASLMLWLEYWLALGPRTLLWEIATSLHWSARVESAVRSGLAWTSGACLVLAAVLGLRAWRSLGASRWAPTRHALLASALLAFPTFSLWSAGRHVVPMLEQQRSPGHFTDLAPVWLYLLFAVSLVAIQRWIARPRIAAALTVAIGALVVLDFAPSRRHYSEGLEMEPLRRIASVLDAQPADGGTLRVGAWLGAQLDDRFRQAYPLTSWLVAQSALGDASTWLTWQSNPQWDPMMMGAMLPRWFGEGEPMEPDAALLRAARVSYLLLKARVPMAEPWRRLAENADLALWELPGHPPVARGYRRFAGLRTDAPPVAVSQALRADVLAVSLPDSVRREEAFRRVPRAAVSHDGTFPIAPAPIEATSRRLAADRIAIEIDAGPQPAMVSISEAYHPWWHARVDGGRVPVVRANLALMAVAVDPGVHRIELRFERPVLLRIAEGVTAAAWIGLVATLLVLRIRSRRDALR